MTFIDRFFGHFEASSALVTEVHGPLIRPTSGVALGGMVALARAQLRQRGVVAGDRVVLVAPNSLRWVAMDIAILAEGAIAVPLYVRQAEAEVAVMIADCAPRVVIREADLVGFFSAGPAPITEPPCPRAPDDIVTIIYTSGTSGEPKGVMLSVANVDFMLPVIASAIQSMLAQRPGTSGAVSASPAVAEVSASPAVAGDRVFHYLPLCFAGSRMVLWMCLFRGSGIMLSTDLQNLAEEMKTARPNYYLNVPFLLERVRLGVEQKLAAKPAPIRALWRRAQNARRDGHASLLDRAAVALAKRLISKKIKAQVGPELDCLICGSAALPEDTQRWFELIGIPVYQVYGLTETTAICTLDRPGEARPGRVGWAIPGIRLRLGEDDELQVEGPHVFPGYWNNPAATAETRTADGWFRTGDQAELAADGSLKLIGRVKNVLVPSSGHNVAPEPLEEKLLRLPGIEQAVVFGHARPYLVALVTGDVDPAALAAPLEALNAELPHYRRIRKLHVSKERLTPENGCLTANQKLKRKAIEHHFAQDLEGLYR